MTTQIEWGDCWWHSAACILASWRVRWFGTFWLCGEGVSMDVPHVHVGIHPHTIFVRNTFAPSFSRRPRRTIAELNELTTEQLQFLLAGGAQ